MQDDCAAIETRASDRYNRIRTYTTRPSFTTALLEGSIRCPDESFDLRMSNAHSKEAMAIYKD